MINKIPIGIKSCKKNIERRLSIEHTWLKTIDLDKFFPVFLIGDKNIANTIDGHNLYLDCGDKYRDLTGKIKAFYAWCIENTNQNYFWTCDDDSYINSKLFNTYSGYINFDYCGNFIYGLEKTQNKTGYTSGCGVCVSRTAAEICCQTLPDSSSEYDDVVVGDVLNAKFRNIKKLHIHTIDPWSYCKNDKKLMIGHYIHNDKKKNFYQNMKLMHSYYHGVDINEKIDYKLYLTGILKRSYNTAIEKETNYQIENNIHFIWIGSKIPDKYISNIVLCKKLNTHYNVIVWLDHDSPKEFEENQIQTRNVNDFDFKCKKYFNEIKEMAGKADLLRYEIIYNEGGVYLDVDIIVMKPFDENFNQSFVSHKEGYYNICNGVFGFNKGSKFLKFVQDSFAENYELSKNQWLPEKTGPTFFTTCFVQYNDQNIKTLHQNFLVYKTKEGYSYHTFDKNW